MKNLISALFLISFSFSVNAQEGPFPFQGSSTIKLNALGGNIQEAAYGVAYQYYLRNNIGLQVNLDYLRVGKGFADNATDIEGNGLRIMPEIRYYTFRGSKRNYVSFYWSAALMFKYNNVKVATWEMSWDDVGGQSFSTYKSTINDVIAFGFMPQVGIEAYLDKQRRFLLDGSLGIGVAKNWISSTQDLFFGRDFFSGYFVSNNQYQGVFPYLNLKVALGYRIVQ